MNYSNIASIETIGHSDVWDISLQEENLYKDEPHFIANGIVLHNCHASGICLSNIPFAEIAPLRTTKVNDDIVSLATQWSYEDLEYLGLVKFDILGISTLTVISYTIKLIKENLDIDIDIENLPLTDAKTLALYKSGELTGVFQCESEGMQKTCMEIGVDRFEDIVAAIALYRPGPMESIPEYCERKKGHKAISYFHPTIEKYVKAILKDTYGIPVYQEQIMRICESLGLMSVSDGLKIIKGISKKDEDAITKGRKTFIKGAIQNEVPSDVINQYWEKFITPYALYGFNLSHSLAYGYLSYICAYLKANFPEEFICSYLNVETKRRKLDRVIELEREARRMGMTILTRDINQCTCRYEIVRKKDEKSGIPNSEIRPSIHCKGLSELAAENIVANRPYNSIREFAEKTDSSVVDAESAQALCDARFFKTKPEKLLEEFRLVREDLKNNKRKGRESRDMFSED